MPQKTAVHPVAAPKELGEWLGPSELMDFSPAICAMARSIASRGKSERERALIAHAIVRAMRLSFPRQSKPASASQVLRQRGGDAIDKATLLVALLRLCDLKARVLFVAPRTEALRGLPSDVCCLPRPMVEVCIDGNWLCTDTFIFDHRYIRAAHHRMRQKHRDYGYGVAARGDIDWDGKRSASVLGDEHLESFGSEATRFNDAAEFTRSMGLIERLTQMGRWMLWPRRSKELERAVRGLRSRQPGLLDSAAYASASVPALGG